VRADSSAANPQVSVIMVTIEGRARKIPFTRAPDMPLPRGRAIVARTSPERMFPT
jgi:hypothetical protein